MSNGLMTTTIFPVGHYTGLRPSDDGGALHTIRIGWQHHRLDEDAFGTWVLAHGVPANGTAAWTEADVLRQADEVKIVGAADQLRLLAANGLVAAVHDDAEQFAQAHRMGVFFVGLGNSPQEPDRFGIGLPGLGTAATLDPGSYELWQWGSIAPTVWHSCQLRAATTERQGPADALAEVLGDLRYLLATGCAYLDVVAPS